RNKEDWAATLYGEAIAAGYGPAWVHSNRAWSCTTIALKDPKKAAYFKLAIEEATTALKLAPDLRAARLNRAMARYHAGFDTQTPAEREECPADMTWVTASGPGNADLYYKAALVFSAGSAGHEERYTQAVAYLRDAIRLGRRPNSLAGDPVLGAHLGKRK